MQAENPYRAPQEHTVAEHEPPPALLRKQIMLRGSIPVRDVFHAQFLILAKRWPYLLMCLAIYLAFVVVLAMLNGSQSLFANTFMVLGLLVMPGILPLSMLMVYLRLHRDSRHRVGIFAATESRLTQEGVIAERSGQTAAIPWSAFSGFLPSHQVVVLFLKESNSHLIVSRAKLAEADDWPLLLEFLHERLTRW